MFCTRFFEIQHFFCVEDLQGQQVVGGEGAGTIVLGNLLGY